MRGSDWSIPPTIWVLIIVFGGSAALLALAYVVTGVLYAIGFVKVWWCFIVRNAMRDIPDVHVWFSNIAQIPLADDALARIEPRMLRDRKAKVGIGRLLERGDGRAAVVCSIDPAAVIVAAYSDAVDDVVLLRFDPTTCAGDLRPGTRLLAVIGYGWMLVDVDPRPLAPDLELGERGVDQFDNVFALVGDFLTDDRAALRRAKAAIPEEEWARAWAMGRAKVKSGAQPRDGRPSRCHRPAAGNLAWARKLVIAMAKGEDYDAAPGPPPARQQTTPRRTIVARRR